ncbi:MAG TPA: Rieske 2Fe-2S domain-containing protein [Stellaceae bacterium]|jgi:phenylpropionate dioxygenase-like ring-hydroxylating dioxygenase large terminal subunit
MTTKQESELLTRVGPGTPMGNLMRHYWLPALKSSELKPDGDPVRLKLLGEELIAFRDSSGRVGIMDHRCPHRCASLFYGRNEEDGIRCIYHGWKYDVEGNCLDQPNLPPHQQFRDKVRAKAYKAAERNGVVYAYMGAADKAPPLPDIAATHIPESEANIAFAFRECNWLQGLEGDIDTSHLNFLHYGAAGAADFAPTDAARFGQIRRDPEYQADEHELGTIYGAYRPAENGSTYWRIAHFLFPCWTLAPFIAFEHYRIARAWVPVDDTHMMFVMIAPKAGPGSVPVTERVLPNTTDFLGRYRLAQNAGNDYQIDRAAQRTRSYTGIEGIHQQDQAVTESMGPITDYSFEHLAASDRMVMITRRRLLAAAKALAETGAMPPGSGVAGAETYGRMRGGYFLAPETRQWGDVYRLQLASVQTQGAAEAAE